MSIRRTWRTARRSPSRTEERRLSSRPMAESGYASHVRSALVAVVIAGVAGAVGGLVSSNTEVGYASAAGFGGVGLVLLELWERTKRRGRKGKLSPPRHPVRTPTRWALMAGYAHGLVLADGGVRMDVRDAAYPLRASGSLPISVDMGGRGVRGERSDDHEHWTWIAEDVALVNNSDDPITCRAWLTTLLGDVPRSPNEVVRIDPRGHTQIELRFDVDLRLRPEEERRDPNDPLEFSLLEIGTDRDYRVGFRTPPTPPSGTSTAAPGPGQ